MKWSNVLDIVLLEIWDSATKNPYEILGYIHGIEDGYVSNLTADTSCLLNCYARPACKTRKQITKLQIWLGYSER